MLGLPTRREIRIGPRKLFRTTTSIEIDAELPAARFVLPKIIVQLLENQAPDAVEPRVIEREPQLVASVRIEVAPDEFGQRMFRAVQKVRRYLGQRNLLAEGPPFARYHRMGREKIELEVGFPVARRFDGTGDVRLGALPGGRMATVIHNGPMEGVAESYRRLEQMIAEQGLEVSAGQWEVYWTLEDPTRRPEEGVTQLVVPVHPKKTAQPDKQDED